MTRTSVDTLLQMASQSLGPRVFLTDFPDRWLPSDLWELLQQRNGMYACVSALHFYPVSGDEVSIETVNAPRGWKASYPADVQAATAFAQDAFGEQFMAAPTRGYFRLNIETGQTQDLGKTLEEMLGVIFSSLADETGYPVAQGWQELFGPLPHNRRLAPAIPFFLGGDPRVEKLKSLHTMERLGAAASIYEQTKDLKDGEQIQLVVIP